LARDEPASSSSRAREEERIEAEKGLRVLAEAGDPEASGPWPMSRPKSPISSGCLGWGRSPNLFLVTTAEERGERARLVFEGPRGSEILRVWLDVWYERLRSEGESPRFATGAEATAAFEASPEYTRFLGQLASSA